jgi:hypothetical protein
MTSLVRRLSPGQAQSIRRDRPPARCYDKTAAACLSLTFRNMAARESSRACRIARRGPSNPRMCYACSFSDQGQAPFHLLADSARARNAPVQRGKKPRRIRQAALGAGYNDCQTKHVGEQGVRGSSHVHAQAAVADGAGPIGGVGPRLTTAVPGSASTASLELAVSVQRSSACYNRRARRPTEAPPGPGHRGPP